MKEITENTKVTLTLGQLKKLVKESEENDKKVAIKNLRDYAANKIIGGDADQEWELPGGAHGVEKADAILRKAGYSKICVLGDRINFRHGSPMEYTLVKNRSGKYAVASLVQEWRTLEMRLQIVDVEQIREYAEILDDNGSDELAKEFMDESTNDEPNFNSIGDYELKLYAELGWNYFNGMRSACDEIVAKINAKHDEREWEKRANDFVDAVNAELGQHLLEPAFIDDPDSFGIAERRSRNALHLFIKDEGAAEEMKDAISRLAIPYQFVMVDTHTRKIDDCVLFDIEFRRK